MKSVCVFCGGNLGSKDAYVEAARVLGGAVARAGLELVYGGASVGLMGAVADAALAAGGRVTGVLPRFMTEREVAHRGLTELVLVGSMDERKTQMIARADAFVALPGGFGTLDELFEVLTLAQLGRHAKPSALLDVDGYFASLTAFLDHATREGLLRPEHRGNLIVEVDADRLLRRLRAIVDADASAQPTTLDPSTRKPSTREPATPDASTARGEAGASPDSSEPVTRPWRPPSS
jgi:uncharacterized protein (TIGR00730 family)